MNALKKGKKFYNIDTVKMSMSIDKAKSMTKDYFTKENAVPALPIPRKPIDKSAFLKEDTFVWLGHSTILGYIDGVTFIVDPMLGERASPLSCLGPKRFEGSLTPVDELPDIDVILITHNHYDHLDQKTIMALHEKVKAIYVPLDNAHILIKWGVESNKVKEFDWFEDHLIEKVQFSFVPTQHFSGRSLTDRDSALWGSWVVKGQQHSIYVSGDSGYNGHFKTIGEKYGPFDVACIECGAYNSAWSEVHMIPEESVQASLDIGAEVMLPMHWAGFDLSTHAWDEPITRALANAKRLGVTTTTPIIGEIVTFSDRIIQTQWWTEK